MGSHENLSVDIRPLIKKVTGITGLKLFAGALAFYFQYLIGNHLGAKETGIYFQVLMIVSIGALVSRLGMDNVVLRHISSAMSLKDYARVNVYIFLSLSIAIIVSCLMAICLYFLNRSSFGFINFFVLNYPEIAILLSLFLFVMTLSQLLAPILLGLGMTRSSVFIEQGMPMLVAVFSIQFLDALTIYTVLLIVVTSWAFSGVFALFMVYKEIKTLYLSNVFSDAREYFIPLIRSSMNQFGIILISRTSAWLAVGFLSIYCSSYIVGQFSIAFRLASVASFILGAVNVVTSPKFASLYEAGQVKKIEYLARKSSLVVGIAAIGVLIITICFSDKIMGYMGKDFASSGDLLIIIMVGQVFNSICGPVGSLLLMSGYEKDMRNMMFFSFVLSILLHLVLIQLYEGVGAAVATSIYVIVWNTALVYIAKIKMGVNLIPGLFSK